MQKLLSILLTGTVLFTLVACQKSADVPKTNVRDDAQKPLYVGDLDKKMNEIYSSENEVAMTVCDKQWRSRILEVSRVLEEKRQDIEEMAKEKRSDDKVVSIDFGSFKFVDDTNTSAGKDQWSSSISSWSTIVDLYDTIKSNPKNLNWVKLNRLARMIVSDDEKRISNKAFYGLSKDSEARVLEIKNKVLSCKADQNCENPDLSAKEWTYLRTGFYYNQFFKIFQKAGNSEDKRAVITAFAKRIQRDADRYVFHKEGLIRVEGKTLVVPMNLSAFGEDGAKKFVFYAEKTWNIDPEYSIKIENVKDSNIPAYMVLIDNSIGGRANVSFDKKLMRLFNWGGIKTITHEFGHVIGFRDNYYTTWSTNTCAYKMEKNEGDLMSVNGTGVVLPTHWTKLKEVYWPAN